jgi:drug/metabolite transporter (DMT)-like permease
MAGIGLTLALHFSFWIKSLELTTVASSVILVTIHPLFVAAVSHLLMEERLSKLNVLGILAALGGATIMTYADYSGGIFAGGSALGDILALLGGVAAGVYILGGRDMRSSLDLLTYVFPVYSFCTVFLFVAVSLTATPLGPITPMAWILLLLMALGPGLLGHTVYNWSLKHVPATVVSVSLLGEPVGASILAFTLLGEVPSLVVILGGSIVLAGIFLTSIRGDSEQEQR